MVETEIQKYKQIINQTISFNKQIINDIKGFYRPTKDAIYSGDSLIDNAEQNLNILIGGEQMNNNIEFYIPEDETIPTQLRLKKGKVKIYYEEKKDKFAYEFVLHEIDNKNQGEAIVKEIADIMCNQSYDHGKEWRVANIECIDFRDTDYGKCGLWLVKFRIRDIY